MSVNRHQLQSHLEQLKLLSLKQERKEYLQKHCNANMVLAIIADDSHSLPVEVLQCDEVWRGLYYTAFPEAPAPDNYTFYYAAYLEQLEQQEVESNVDKLERAPLVVKNQQPAQANYRLKKALGLGLVAGGETIALAGVVAAGLFLTGVVSFNPLALMIAIGVTTLASALVLGSGCHLFFSSKKPQESDGNSSNMELCTL